MLLEIEAEIFFMQDVFCTSEQCPLLKCSVKGGGVFRAARFQGCLQGIALASALQVI